MADRFRITQAWAQRFKAEGISIPRLLHCAGLPPNFFEQENIFVTTSKLFAIWKSVEELSSDPGFGLKLGEEIKFEKSHPVSIAGVCSRTFGDALERLARYKQLTCPEEIRVNREDLEASVEFYFNETEEAQPNIMVDLGLSWILFVAKRGSEGHITPCRLELTRPVLNREMLENHFGCQVHFRAARNALVFHSSDLDLPFVTSNEEFVDILGMHLDNELEVNKSSVNLIQKIKLAMKRSLAGKRPALLDVAHELGMSSRTLQRRLTDAGNSFKQILEETRREQSHYYLKQSSMELTEIAFLLGFVDASSFCRAFQGWEGTSPTAWRNQHPESFQSAKSVR